MAGIDVDAVARRARRAGIGVRTMDGFYAEGPPGSGLVLGYGAIATDRVGDGLRRLADAFGASGD
jgi:DNA-binding transcriptional MocR family regulator